MELKSGELYVLMHRMATKLTDELDKQAPSLSKLMVLPAAYKNPACGGGSTATTSKPFYKKCGKMVKSFL